MINECLSNDRSNQLSACGRGRRKGSKNFHPWQKEILEEWLRTHGNDLYPAEKVKSRLARDIKTCKKKVSNWFINMRKVRKIQIKLIQLKN